MRDGHRIREKFELSLDGRQIGSLLIGGIIVLGAVFVVGVVVGKKLASSSAPKPSLDVLTTLDRRAEALQKDRKAQLTFQKVLTQPAPPPETPVEDAARRSIHPAPEAAPAPKPPEKPAPVAEPLAPSEAAEKASAPKPNPKETLQAAFAEVSRKPSPPSPAKAEVPPGGYTLQVLSSQDRDESKAKADALRQKGYAASVASADLGARGIWYRVYVGHFETREQASRYLTDLRRETHLDGFVVER